MGDLLDEYALLPNCWDELFEEKGIPRSHYQSLHTLLGTLSAGEFEGRCRARDLAFRDQGITFSLSGEERPFPLDLVPRIIPAAEWAIIEAGVAQRVRALEAFLADVYGPPGRSWPTASIPRRLVLTSQPVLPPGGRGRARPTACASTSPGSIWCATPTAHYLVLEDNVRTPSGISYVIENRRAMTHVFPELFASHRIRPVADYPAHLLEALRRAAPRERSQPTVVVLTPGVPNSAYFEHVFLARQMGVELVEGRDLVCRDGVVYMRTTAGEAPGRRRLPPDRRRLPRPAPLPARLAARLPRHRRRGPGRQRRHRQRGRQRGRRRQGRLSPTCPGSSSTTWASGPILHNVPDLHPRRPRRSSPTSWPGWTTLVLKPVDGSGGHGLVIGPPGQRRPAGRAATCGVRADPRGWIAQEVVQLSTLTHPRRRATSAPGTSTCGPSPSTTANGSGWRRGA